MDHTPVAFRRDGAVGVCRRELEPRIDFFVRDFKAWLTRAPARVYLERPNLVAAVRLPAAAAGTELPTIVKRFGWRSPFHRWLRLGRDGRALRSFRIAQALLRAGVSTPPPLIAWERQAAGGIEAYYIAEEILDALPLRKALAAATPEAAADLTRRAARLVRAMHDAGVYHRDLTLGNFLTHSDAALGHPIYLIDLSRATQLERVPLALRLADLARINLQNLWPVFFETYCEGRPDWLARRRLLAGLIWLRRRRVDLRKALR